MWHPVDLILSAGTQRYGTVCETKKWKNGQGAICVLFCASNVLLLSQNLVARSWPCFLCPSDDSKLRRRDTPRAFGTPSYGKSSPNAAVLAEEEEEEEEAELQQAVEAAEAAKKRVCASCWFLLLWAYTVQHIYLLLATVDVRILGYAFPVFCLRWVGSEWVQCSPSVSLLLLPMVCKYMYWLICVLFK